MNQENKALSSNIEAEPKPTATFISRGDNPFMGALANLLRKRGMEVMVRQLPIEEIDTLVGKIQRHRSYDWTDELKFTESVQLDELKSDLERLIGRGIRGVAVTDRGHWTGIAKYFKLLDEPINAYESLWNPDNAFGEQPFTKYLNSVGFLAQEIESSGKTPVVIQAHLEDHFGSSFQTPDDPNFEEFTKKIRAQSVDPADNSDLVDFEEADFEEINPDLDIALTLKYYHPSIVIAPIKKNGYQGREVVMGDDPEYPKIEKPVFLVDHHFTYKSSAEYQENGVDLLSESPEIALVCPCCINNDKNFKGDYMDLAKEKGYQLFPYTPGVNNIDQIAESLAQSIKERSQHKDN